jgi:hypothetical protein
LVSQAKCFEHSKEINIGIAELLKLEQDYQKRTEFFTAICNLSLAKLVAIAIYKLPVSEVINAKCFAPDFRKIMRAGHAEALPIAA